MMYIPVVTRAPISDLAANYIAARAVNDPRTLASTPITPERVRKDYLTIHAYYPSLFLKQTTQEASYSTMALLADIGGAMGLVLGGTVLTLCEVMDFCFSQMFPRKKESNNPQKDKSDI